MASKKKGESVELDAKYLKGLTFHGTEEKKVKAEDGVKVKNVPIERDLTVDDVLDWSETETSVTIVTADGKKYTVAKGK